MGLLDSPSSDDTGVCIVVVVVVGMVVVEVEVVEVEGSEVDVVGVIVVVDVVGVVATVVVELYRFSGTLPEDKVRPLLSLSIFTR